MSDEPANALPEPAPESTPEPALAAPRRPRGAGLAVLVAVLALALGGVNLWRDYSAGQDQDGANAALREALDQRIDALQHALDQRKRDVDSLRTRLADVSGVNRSVREELLALGERSRHLEDAVANLAEQRLSGRDALARNEAEFLLQQAQVRLQLFHDAESAMLAYRLADSALAAAEDPVFASVRDTIHAELAALEASKPQQVQAGLATLERVRTQLASLPPASVATGPDAAAPSRWREFIDQFVRIRHDDEAVRARGSAPLDRALIALDLREAEAALLAREPAAYKAALARAQEGIEAGFDSAAAPTRAALDALARLAAAPLAPSIPELGSALKELRNLRVTRALAQPPAAGPATPDAPDSPATSEPPDSPAGPESPTKPPAPGTQMEAMP